MSSDWGDVVESLQGALARLQRIDLWPPWDAVSSVVDAINAAYAVATEPPGPAVDDLDEAATGWHKVALHWEQARDDATTSHDRTGHPGVWEGEAGTAFRRSMWALSSRFDSVYRSARAVEGALVDCEGPLGAARIRHVNAYVALAHHLSIHLGDVLEPWKAVDKLRGIVEGVSDMIRELIGSYQDAAVAVEDCRTAVVAAIDTIELPTTLVAGVSAIDQVNLFKGADGIGDDVGPLRGSTAERAQAALDAMTPEQRAAAQALLDGAADQTSRGWILAAIASGLGGTALDRYAQHLATMTPEEVAALDPTVHLTTGLTNPPGPFWQPDGTTCGSSSLVLARMLNDPAYAMSVLTGYDPRTGQQAEWLDAVAPSRASDWMLPLADEDPSAQMQRRFWQEVDQMHDQTSGLTTHDGGFNGAWPKAWGTSPGAAARQMGGGDGLSGVPGSSYRVEYVDPTDRALTYDDIVAAVDQGQAVPVFTYDIQNDNNASGAHVTLVTGSEGDNLVVYDPWYATTVTVSREQFITAQLEDTLGWDRPMAAVLPR